MVQAFVPASQAGAIASLPEVDFVQAPRQITRPPVFVPGRPELGPGLGSTVGENVGVINASAWQAAGIGGAVKVGIIDYFATVRFVAK